MQVGQSLNAAKLALRTGEQRERMQNNASTQDREGCIPEEVVQGEVGGCPLGEAMWTTKGRKARYTILQAIETCKRKNPCHCWRDDKYAKTYSRRAKKALRAASGETKES
jgi:hypothetical protein